MEIQNGHELETQAEPQLLNGIHYTGNKGPCFGARHSMIIMVSLAASIMMATNTAFSVIIVAMTTSNTSSNANIPTYNWDNKGMILSSNIWLGIPIQLIAGHLGKRYGHKWLIMGAVVVNVAFFMLIPLFATIGGSIGVLVCRFIEGGANGILGPVAVGVTGLWVPAEERSQAGMISVAIVFVTIISTYLTTGQIAASSWGYPACCYILGALGFVWCFAWYFLGHQSPAVHSRISPEERKYIETSLHLRKAQHVIPTPWLKILTSIKFWAPVVGGIGSTWIDTITSTVNVIYINKVWEIDVAKGTTITSIGPTVGILVGIFLALLSDFLVGKNYIRLVNARKIFHTVGVVGNSIALLWMTWIPGKSTGLIILNYIIANIFTIAYNIGGSGLNILDIAPAFAGIINGFANTFAQCFGLFAPLTIDWILQDQSDPTQWRIIFYLTAAIATGTAIFFDIFATDKRQWDDTDEDEPNNKD